MKLFKLYYHLRNGGDGSASIQLHETEDEARKAANEEEGWGEPCDGEIKLKLVDDKIYYEVYKEIDGKYQSILVECEQI